MSENPKNNRNNSELLNIQTNAENDPNRAVSSEQLVKRILLENTPFEIIGNDEIGYFLAFGKYKLTLPLSTVDEVKEELETKKWYIIANMASVIFEEFKKAEDLDKIAQI